MPWFSGIPKINNKEIAPNERWDKIYNSISSIFPKQTAPRGMKSKINRYLDSVTKNREILIQYDSKVLANELISVLRPGRTTTLLLADENQINDIQREYGGLINGPYVNIELKEKGPDTKKYPVLRLLSKRNYDTALEILGSLKSPYAFNVIVKNLIVKVELAAFCKGGDRRARWRLDNIHPEFAEENGCYGVAAKLLYYILDILKADLKKKNIENYTSSIDQAKKICMKEFNEKEIQFVNNIYPKCSCPMCLNEISLIDFFRNGRNDPYSIVFGHYEYRGARSGDVHIGKNSFWIHRLCNSIQGIYTIEETLQILKNLMINHNKQIIDWELRG